MELTFGEQIMILLKRKKMSVQDLAERVSALGRETISGKDLAHLLSVDNFSEKEMQRIAQALGCRLRIDLLTGTEAPAEPTVRTEEAQAPAPDNAETDFPPLFGDNADLTLNDPPATPIPERDPDPYYIEMSEPDREQLSRQVSQMLSMAGNADRKKRPPRAVEPAAPAAPADVPAASEAGLSLPEGSLNPLTGEEYLTNSVRRLPDKPGMVEVYDRTEHTWTETSEEEFRRFQYQKRAMLGDDYDPPIWL